MIKSPCSNSNPFDPAHLFFNTETMKEKINSTMLMPSISGTRSHWKNNSFLGFENDSKRIKNDKIILSKAVSLPDLTVSLCDAMRNNK